VLLLQDHVAPFGAQRHLDSVGQLVDASFQSAARLFVKFEQIGHLIQSPSFSYDMAPDTIPGKSSGHASTTARMSFSLMMRYSVPSTLTSVPAYFENRTLSPTFTVRATLSPLGRTRPLPTATTLPSW